MVEQIDLKDREVEGDSKVLIPEVIEGTESQDAPKESGKGWLKGWLPMAICCSAPFLLLLAVPLLGSIFGSLAAVASGLLSIVAVLACPVGMYLMMRMMNKK